jgi:hypothetical protein
LTGGTRRAVEAIEIDEVGGSLLKLAMDLLDLMDVHHSCIRGIRHHSTFEAIDGVVSGDDENTVSRKIGEVRSNRKHQGSALTRLNHQRGYRGGLVTVCIAGRARGTENAENGTDGEGGNGRGGGKQVSSDGDVLVHGQGGADV